MDTQVVELLGRNRLVDELLRADLEVAFPLRDRGIDLIAYAERGKDLKSFVACPIQMKACSTQAFGVHAKYKPVRGLLIAYLWNLSTPDQTETYAMTYRETLAIARRVGWTKTAAWATGAYTTSSPSARLRELLVPYRMTAARWRERVREVGAQAI